MSIVFVGGWATSAQQYPLLSDSARFLIPFTGFKPDELPELLGEGGDVLVGWSTGAHMLLKDCRHLFKLYGKVILIAPFLSFTDSFPVRLVRGMIAGMESDPAAVVSSFHDNCGETNPPAYDPADRSSLIAGLEYLVSSKIETEGFFHLPNCTMIHGSKDRIVRSKAFEKLTAVIEGADVINVEGGHKISETQLMSIIKG
ncbi:alpha/beta hydrolase [Maridesulfovibrio sp.]|uniref:alpha/beta hydrolase n=1 Tax=Maridesulfovibrio sp. TaxID=2795000 RepID=UPI002A18983D|nr:alpha/beta hydrolase [Maridesulfovibrio sp.]